MIVVIGEVFLSSVFPVVDAVETMVMNGGLRVTGYFRLLARVP